MGRKDNKTIRDFQVKRYWFEDAGDKNEEGYYDYYYAGFNYDLKFKQLTYLVRRYYDTPAEASIRLPKEREQDGYNLYEDQLVERVVKYLIEELGVEKIYAFYNGYSELDLPKILRSRVIFDFPKPIWCVVSDVTEDYSYTFKGGAWDGKTVHAAVGTTVYCLPPIIGESDWGDGYSSLAVFAYQADTMSYHKMVIPAKLLRNWRVEYIDEAEVCKRMAPFWDGTDEAQQLAKQFVSTIQSGERLNQHPYLLVRE